MRFGSASMTVTGTVSPASLKTRVIPALRPTRPRVLVALIVCPLVPSAPSCDWLAGHKKTHAPQRRGGDFREFRRRGRPAARPVTPLERYPVRARPRRKRGANYRDTGLYCKPVSESG